MNNPKFKLGQEVNHKADLYGCTTSTIVELHRVFYNNDGGLAYIERDLKSMRKEIKWEIIESTNPVLVIHPYETTEWCAKSNGFVPTLSKLKEIKFGYYAYSVRSEKMGTIFSEKQLKKK
jgi:hypothetical protein